MLMVYMRNLRRKKSSKIVIENGRHVVDLAMHDLVQKDEIKSWGLKEVHSGKSVADVWGNLVLAYNYKFPIDHDLSDMQSKNLKELIDSCFIEYCQQHRLFWEGKPSLVVSDLWSRNSVLEIDVAYVVNLATSDYLKDLNKL